MTPAQKQVLDFIQPYYRANGYAPTIKEIMAAIGGRSTQHVHKKVQTLIDDGHLVRIAGRHRNIAPVDQLGRFTTAELQAEIARRIGGGHG